MFSAKSYTEEGKKDIALALANRSAVLIKVHTYIINTYTLLNICAFKCQHLYGTFVHLKASTFMAPYLYQFSAVVQKLHFLVLFGINLHQIKCKFSIMILKNDARTAISNMVLFQTNLVINTATASTKAPYLKRHLALFWCK